MPPGTSLSSILLSIRTHFLKDQNRKKYQHYIDVWGEVLPTQALFYMKMKEDLMSVKNDFSF